jgi:hypothetical protein
MPKPSFDSRGPRYSWIHYQTYCWNSAGAYWFQLFWPMFTDVILVAIYPIWRRPSFWDLHSHCWFRPAWQQAAIVSNRAQWYLQCLEGEGSSTSYSSVTRSHVMSFWRQTPSAAHRKLSVNSWRRTTKTIWHGKRALSWLWKVYWRSYKRAPKILKSVLWRAMEKLQ